MVLSSEGLDYICLNFGLNNCCVENGLTWFYTKDEVPYPENGGTAQIVSRLSLGLIDFLTITTPDRGVFTQAELNAANEQSVTLQDAQEIANHDSPQEIQWCLGETPEEPAPPPYLLIGSIGVIGAGIIIYLLMRKK